MKFSSPSQKSRRFLFCLAAITIVALLLRLWVCSELGGVRSAVNPSSATDMATYKRIAIDILGGKWPEYFYYQPFYYAVYLPVIYKIFGQGTWGVMLIQCLLGAATVWLTALATARLFGRRAAIIAAVLLACARFPLFYTPFLLIATLQSFWMALLLWLAVSARRGSLWKWLALAVVSALAILTRGNVLLLVPGMLALMVWRERKRPIWQTALMVLGFVALLYLPQLPFALRNYTYYERWTGPSSAQDAVLALGNTPEAPPGGLEYPATYMEWLDAANRPPGERIPVSSKMLAWARREPIHFLELKFRTFLLFWNHREIPNNIAIRNEGKSSLLLKCPLLPSFGFIATLAVFGMLINLRLRSPARLFTYSLPIVYCAATVLFYVLARFRIPMVPALCVFAGGGVVRTHCLWRQTKGEAGRRLRLLLGFVLLLSVYLVFFAFGYYQNQYEAAVMRTLRPNGIRVETRERLIVYDHGPLGSAGGIFPVSLPAKGMKIRKTFILPEGIPENATPLLRLGVLLGKNSRFSLTMTGAVKHEDPNIPPFEKCLLGFQWCNIPLEPLKGKAGDEVAITITIKGEDGPVSLLFDQFREYGRTVHLQPTGEQALPEAIWELHWPLPAAKAPTSEDQ